MGRNFTDCPEPVHGHSNGLGAQLVLSTVIYCYNIYFVNNIKVGIH